MALNIDFVKRNIHRPFWISRRNEDGELVNDSIKNLKEGDNVMFGKDASEEDFITAYNLARSLGLRFTAERECRNGVIQVWAVSVN
jgi:hypothetical protein